MAADSPHKTLTTLTARRTKQRMEDVKAKLVMADELRSVNTLAFLEKMFPVDGCIIESVFQSVQKTGLYKDGRWTKLPKEPNSEDQIYDPFAEMANAIVKATPNKTTNIIYVSRPNVPPKSLENNVAAGRPDGAGAQPDDQWNQLEQTILRREQEYEQERDKTVAARTRSGNKRKRDEMEKEVEELQACKSRLIDVYKLWWMCIHNLYEIKLAKSEEERYNAAIQAVAYMHQLLMEQLDRRFVMGFTLLLDELSLILCDRSGLLMTNEVINIHKEPKKLIQVIAGFSLMTPAELGWDTSMKIYRPVTNDIKPSYEVASRFEGVNGNGRYNIHWVIDVDQDDKMVKYVTVSTISAPRPAERTGTLPYMSAEVIQSRCVIQPGDMLSVPDFAHQAIHDLESFLWVLVRICLTRKGPGINQLRDELRKECPEYDPTVFKVVCQHFDADKSTILAAKSTLLLQPHHFEANIVAHFHPYFDPIKDVVRNWWKILILGYKYRAYEFFNIHECIIRLLDDALQNLDKSDEAEELDRREKLERRRLATFGPKRLETPSNSPTGPDLATPNNHHLVPMSQYPPQEDEGSPSKPAKRRNVKV